MCTYRTEKIEVAGSAKGTASWLRVRQANVYFDHPQHAMTDHSLNIDFTDPAQGANARIAIELSAESAEQLCAAIQTILRDADELGVLERRSPTAVAG